MTTNAYKEILIFVTGSTPQIITETIYGLVTKHPSVVPDEIHVITTSFGKSRIGQALMESGVLREFCAEFDLPPSLADAISFEIITDDAGKEIDDIRGEKENAATGDTIVSVLRALAAAPHTRLHCCLAGGRKTMSFYLGAGLQLFGRPWDKLYHVLVTPEFESRPDFFFKPRKNTVIESRLPDGSVRQLNTDDAEIILAELPFIRLREKLDLGGKGFQELVAEGQTNVDTAIVQPDLVVNPFDRTIKIGPHPIEMAPVQLMLYLTFLRRKLEDCKRPGQRYCGNCTDCFRTLGEIVTDHKLLARMGADYEAIYRNSPGKAGELLPHWKGDDGVRLIRQHRSKVNGKIREVLNDSTIASSYIIDSVRRYGDTRYGVRVEKRKIKMSKC